MMKFVVCAFVTTLSVVGGVSSSSSTNLRASFLNATTATAQSNPFRMLQYKPSLDDLERERQERKERMKQSREAFKKTFQQRGPPQPPLAPNQAEPVPEDQWYRIPEERKLTWGFGKSKSADLVSSGVLADPSQQYDKWAQAYRMLGGFIDCDHNKDRGSHDSGGGNNGDGKNACSRWMMWAAYVNPNYQGNAYNEYFGDEPTSMLDCHSPDTEWKLLGVYRQEFYQYIEQISKHLWAIDEYEYVTALAGLAYMTDDDCFYVGQDSSGNSIYAGVAPREYGYFEMALYTDQYCITPNDSLGMTFDDFGLTSGINLGSKDATDDDSYSWAYDWWYGAQEYTLTNLNEVYNEYKYCTSCVDYPTYQDGYFIGDDGTDDDDLINQCWKFYSHDSYTCEAECIAMAHAQGTILSLKYGDVTFGKTSRNFYSQDPYTEKAQSPKESAFSRLLANASLTCSFLLFVATFLAFAVARRSRYRESKSGKSRRLLDDEDDKKSRKSRRSKEGDGLFRSTSRNRSSSRKASSSRRSSKSKRSSSRTKSYEPPK